MGLRNIAFMQSALQGIKQNADDYRELQAAKVKQKQEREKFDLDMKIKKLEIDKAEKIGELDDADILLMRDRWKKESSSGKSNLDLEDSTVGALATQKKKAIKTGVTQYKNLANDEMKERSFAASLPGYEMSVTRQFGELPKRTWKKKEEPTFDETLQKAELGEISFDDVRKKFPSKADAVQKARVGRLPKRAQLLIPQMQQQLKDTANVKEFEKTADDLIEQLESRREEAEAQGIDVDEILDIIGISKDDIKFGKKGVFEKFKKFMTTPFFNRSE